MNAFSAGLNNNNQVKLAAQHYYRNAAADVFNGDQRKELTSHAAIVAKMANHVKAIKYLQQHGNVPYVLSETGSSLQGGTEFKNDFGACLWDVDFILYAMSVVSIPLSSRPVNVWSTSHSGVSKR